MTKTGKSIGVFDSGFGGINILAGIVKQLPEYNYLYLGDTARTPYGSRSSELIYEFSTQVIDSMFAQNCELIIFACNTASSDALRKIQEEYVPKNHPGKKVLGVLIPAAEIAVLKTKNNKVGVIATEGTVRSGAFTREVAKLNPKIKVFEYACPLLVPIVEAGEQNSPAAKLVLEKYLAPLKKKGIDTLILGCTHYGILENQIRKILGKDIVIVSEAKVIPKKLKAYLTAHQDIEKKLGKNSVIRFQSTDVTERFTTLGSKFFGKKITVEKIILS